MIAAAQETVMTWELELSIYLLIALGCIAFARRRR